MLMVTAYGLYYVQKWTKPLDQVKGMSYGVREDAISGVRRGLVSNQCISEESKGVYTWLIFDREERRKTLQETVDILAAELKKNPMVGADFDIAMKELDTYNHACYPSDDTEVQHG